MVAGGLFLGLALLFAIGEWAGRGAAVMRAHMVGAGLTLVGFVWALIGVVAFVIGAPYASGGGVAGAVLFYGFFFVGPGVGLAVLGCVLALLPVRGDRP